MIDRTTRSGEMSRDGSRGFQAETSVETVFDQIAASYWNDSWETC